MERQAHKNGLDWVTMIPEAVLLVAGVCAVVNGVGGGGTAAPVNTSAPTISAVTTQAPALATQDRAAHRVSPGSAALLLAQPAAPGHSVAAQCHAQPK